MNTEKCKKCKWHNEDTLSDGTKQDYCYPPIMIDMIAFSIPCVKRTEKDCKKILKNIKNSFVSN